MNDENREEPARYVDLDTCDYLVDLSIGRESLLEPDYAQVPGVAVFAFASHQLSLESCEQDVDRWVEVVAFPFLDAASTPLPSRALWIPGLYERQARYVNVWPRAVDNR